MTPRSEWRGRADFAEIAEAVGVATDTIIAVYLGSGKAIIVAYSRPEDGDDAWLARLRRRDADGILEHLEPPQHMPGMVAQLRAGMLRKGGPQ